MLQWFFLSKPRPYVLGPFTVNRWIISAVLHADLANKVKLTAYSGVKIIANLSFSWCFYPKHLNGIQSMHLACVFSGNWTHDLLLLFPVYILTWSIFLMVLVIYNPGGTDGHFIIPTPHTSKNVNSGTLMDCGCLTVSLGCFPKDSFIRRTNSTAIKPSRQEQT